MDSGRGRSAKLSPSRCPPGPPASSPRTLKPEKELTKNCFSWIGCARWWGVSYLMFQQACAPGVDHPKWEKLDSERLSIFPKVTQPFWKEPDHRLTPGCFLQSSGLPHPHSTCYPASPSCLVLPCSPGVLINGHTSCCRCYVSHGQKGLQLALTNGGLVPRPAVLSLLEGTQSWACRDFFPPSSPGTRGSLLVE